MNMTSHLALAVGLSEVLDLRTVAFIFGNVQPDLALYSYLRGGRLQGHSFRNMSPRIDAVLAKLRKGRGDGLLHSYRLGKLMHYIADSFTYPHNDSFHGSLRAHMLYEDELEVSLQEHMEEEGFRPSAKLTVDDVAEYVRRRHEDYMAKEGSTDNDSSFILESCASVAWALATERRLARPAVGIS